MLKDSRECQGQDGKTWFACVVRIGTNFIEVESLHHNERIHIDDFERRCRLEPDAQGILDREVAVSQSEIQQLMREVQAITERLSVQEALPEASDTQALALLSDVDYEGYKTSLEKAKSEDLPALFEKIKKASERLTDWLTATAIPLKADYDWQDGIIKRIEGKIFHVQLYAGLVEEVVQIREGKPAPAGEKLHMFQRKHFMDEECLVDYKAGGMQFKNIEQFDKWMKRKRNRERNRERILPFPRCCVAFQVRRRDKDYGTPTSWLEFINFSELHELGRKTFLYIRNGKQLFRLNTEIDFGDKVFPDRDRAQFHGKLWVNREHFEKSKIIDQNQYDELDVEYKLARKKYRKKKKKWLADPERGKKHGKHSIFGPSRPSNEQKDYEPFDQSNLYYDDTVRDLAEEIAHFNRIALVLQGVYDRSSVLAPHPKVKLWDPEGFDAAVELVYDLDRALHQDKKPDFETYLSRLNESLGVGSVTVGQHAVWLAKEADKDYERQRNNWRVKNPSRPGRWWSGPYGNDGPGVVARVVKFQKRARRCVYAWERERLRKDQWKDQSETIRTTIAVDTDKLLNIDAYTPGDYKQFFQDPRTRQEYLEWAPLLFAAEDYHAGEAKLDG